MDSIIINDIVSTIETPKLELFFKFFKTGRKERFSSLFDAKDYGVLVKVYDFLIDRNTRCLREFGFPIKREIELEFNQAIRQRIKREINGK